MMRASVGAVFPPRVWSPCGCARGELCAHRGGTSQVKFGSRKERTGRARQWAPGERRTFSCHLSPSSTKQTGVPPEKSEQDPQTARGRHAASGEMDFDASSPGFDNARMR
ncbi:hypothetical protein INR49_015965 [Caranx melampygus]|nr:hypothetical protein INR49_015965 [Caranx melampygus]